MPRVTCHQTSHRRPVLLPAALIAAIFGLGVASPAFAAKPKLVIGDYFAAGATHDLMQTIVENFARTNPDIEVVRAPYEYGILVDGKMFVQLLNNIAPTVFLMPNVYTLNYADRGFLLDLTSWIKESPWVRQAFIDPIIGSNRDSRGRVWGIPQGLQMVAVYYNTEYFQNAGLSHPPENWTWETFAALAKKLLRTHPDGKTRVYGASITAGYAYGGWSMFRSLGGRALSEDGRVSSVDEGDAMVRTISYLADGVGSGYFWYSSDAGLDQEAMVPMQYWDVAALKQLDMPFDVAPLPMGPNGRFAPTVANSWVITASADPAAQRAAWRWIEHYSSVPVQIKWALEGEAAPANPRAAGEVFRAKNVTPPHLSVFVEGMNYVDWIGNNPIWNDWFFTALATNLEKGATGRISALEAVFQADRAAQALLDDYYRDQ